MKSRVYCSLVYTRRKRRRRLYVRHGYTKIGDTFIQRWAGERERRISAKILRPSKKKKKKKGFHFRWCHRPLCIFQWRSSFLLIVCREYDIASLFLFRDLWRSFCSVHFRLETMAMWKKVISFLIFSQRRSVCIYHFLFCHLLCLVQTDFRLLSALSLFADTDRKIVSSTVRLSPPCAHEPKAKK